MVANNNNNNNNNNNGGDNTNAKSSSSSSSLSSSSMEQHHQHQHRPSDVRRQQLQNQIKIPNVSNFFPIERYYNVADILYNEIQHISRLVQAQPEAKMTLNDIPSSSSSSFQQQQQLQYDIAFNTGLDMTYLYAKRYYTLCLNGISQHHYYNLPKYFIPKQKHILQMKKIIQLLTHIVNQMDVQEQLLLYIKEQEERREQLQLLERHRLLQESSSSSSLKKLNDSSTTTTTLSVQESAIEKLKRLMPPSTTIPSSLDDETTTTPKPSRSSTRYRLDDDDDESTILPPNHTVVSLDGIQPLLPPNINNNNNNITGAVTSPTPPSYDAVIAGLQHRIQHHPNSANGPYQVNDDNNKSYIRPPPSSSSLSELVSSTEQIKPPKEKIRPPPPPPPMKQQQEYYRAKYMKYQECGKIRVSSIDTYQGRIVESTNGCTVISALIVARHLEETTKSMISNTTIQNVIDVQCGPILRTIRKKLGLHGHALIIPSDVHDHLVDDKILLQDQFTGAAGGNIMYPPHYRELLQLLSSSTSSSSDTTTTSSSSNNKNGKAGATLFFREHVISIVKSIHPKTQQSYYDLIDSMPGIVQNGKSMATRTRCIDMDSLEVLLLWYASRKFSDTNCNYIDRNPWDDNNADLDPRVFQGFVWSS